MNRDGNWWKAPSRATDVDEHRVVSTIELFCDLVFIAYVATITHKLSAHMDGHGIQSFVLHFTIGWVIWFNSALYHDLHGNNDFKTRLITFVQMLFIGLMAAFSNNSMSSAYAGYMISLSSIIFILGLLWHETGIVDPSHRVYAEPYSRMFFIASLFGLVSILLNETYRLFYLGVIIALITTPLVTTYLSVNKKLKKEFVVRMKLSNAFIERSNLYFIIMLGEIIIGSLNGFAKHGFEAKSLILLLFSFLVAFGIWFTHFEFIGHIQHKETIWGYYMWLFSFYLETMMVAALGSAIYMNYINMSIDVLIVPTAIFFVATLIHFTFNEDIANPNIHIDTTYAKNYMISSFLLLALAYVIHSLLIQILTYLIALYIPVVFGLRQWMKNR